MADKRIKGITIEINGDTSGLDKALKGVESESRKAQSELRDVDKALKEAPKSAELWKQKQELLNKSLEESKKKLKILEDAQEQVERKFRDGEIDDGQYRAFQRELERTRGETKKLEENIETTNKEIENLGNTAERSGDKVERSTSAYKVMAGGIAAISAAAVEAIKTADEMSQSYDIIVKKTGATGETLDRLKMSAQNVFTSLPIDINSAAVAVGEVNTRFSVTGETLEELSKKFIRFSEINDTDLNNSIGMTSKVMKQWNVDISDIDGLLGLLTKKAQDTGISVDSLLNSVQNNGATFKEMGLSLIESIDLLAQFEANGVNADTAIAGLRKGIKNATDSGKTLEQALSETISSIQNAKSETEALSKAQDIFGTKGAAEMANAIREGRINLEGLTSDMSSYKDVVADTYEATLSPMERMKTIGNESKAAIGQIGEALTAALLPTAEKLLPEIKNNTEWLANNAPKILKTGKDLLPIITGIGTAWATWKVAKTATEGAEAVVGFAKAVRSGESAMKLLNLTMLENPAIAVASAIVALTAAMIVWKSTQEKELSIAEKVAEAYKKESDAIAKTGDSISDLNGKFNDSAESIDFEFKRVESLWKELDKLTDASGRVKAADKDRAEYILNQLNDALGTEFAMTGNQIENYRTMQIEIDKLIAKKKAQAYLDAYLANAPEMARAKQESLEENQIAFSQYQAALADVDAKQKAFDAVNDTGISAQMIANASQRDRSLWGVTDEQYRAAAALETAIQTKGDALSRMNTSRGNYDRAVDYYNKLDQAETAFAEGDFKSVESALYTNKDSSKSVLESYSEVDDELRRLYKEGVDKDTAALRLALDNREKEQIDSTLKTMGETVAVGKQKGIETGALFTGEMRKNFKKMADDGFDISSLTKWAWDSGIKVSEVFGGEYRKVVQKQLDEGYDIEYLLRWGKESGIDVAAEYSAEYYKLVQRQLDAGYDISELLRWGAGSGFDVSSLFSDEFMKRFQSNIDKGFDTSALIEWAIDNGAATGDLFGDNFRTRVNQYIYEVNKLTPSQTGRITVNSNDDANKVSVRRYASGGYIHSGSRGIVAEAGPELIEIMNGGVRITPLSGNASNTPADQSGGAGQKVFYNTYNINNPRISSSMDIRRIAQEMAAEQRRIENGRGL